MKGDVENLCGFGEHNNRDKTGAIGRRRQERVEAVVRCAEQPVKVHVEEHLVR